MPMSIIEAARTATNSGPKNICDLILSLCVFNVFMYIIS